MERLGLGGLLDIGLRTGPYGAGWWPWRSGLSLSRLVAAPAGIDLGPLEPRLPDRLHTPDATIQLAPPQLLADVARLARSSGRQLHPPGRLALIGRRDLRSNNSWMHNTTRLVRGATRCTLLMHPDDATARGLSAGTPVRVTSRVGAVVVPLEVTDAMMPGVVSLPHGWGHGRAGVQLRVAREHAGVSINDLTDDECIDVPSGNAAFSGVSVTVASAGSDPTSLA